MVVRVFVVIYFDLFHDVYASVQKSYPTKTMSMLIFKPFYIKKKGKKKRKAN
jgi:hypothetical protein